MKETKILSSQDMSGNMIEELRSEGWVFESTKVVKKEIFEVHHIYTREKNE